MGESGGSDGVVDSGEGAEYDSAEYQTNSELSSDSYSKEISSENREKADSERLSFHQSVTGGKTNLEKIRGGTEPTKSGRMPPVSDWRCSSSYFDKGLEELIKSDSLTTEELVKSLQGEEAKYVQEELYTRDSLTDRIEHSHNWSLSNWAKTVSNYIKNANLIDGIKGFWYLTLALTDNARNESPFERIDKGAKYIFFPGYLAIPRNIELFEKHLGEKCAYVESTDPDYIKQVADYMYSKQGAVKVIGFSDGVKTIRDYIMEHGIGNIQSIHAIAGNPLPFQHPRVHYYLGDRDWIAPSEKGYPYSFISVRGVEIYHGGHTLPFYDEKTAKEVAGMIRENSHAGKIQPEPQGLITQSISYALEHYTTSSARTIFVPEFCPN